MSQEGQQNAIKLLCLDWDLTITDRHMGNILLPSTSYNNNCPQAYISRYKSSEQLPAKINPQDNADIKCWTDKVVSSLKHQEKIKNLMQEVHNIGAKLAIVTFNQHPDVICDVLKALDINSQVLDNMVVIYGGNVRSDKNKHLTGAMDFFNITDKNEVLFVDDSSLNFGKATREGYKSILATSDKTWIEEALGYLQASPKYVSTPCQKSAKEMLEINTKFMTYLADPAATESIDETKSVDDVPIISLPNFKSPSCSATVSALSYTNRDNSPYTRLGSLQKAPPKNNLLKQFQILVKETNSDSKTLSTTSTLSNTSTYEEFKTQLSGESSSEPSDE